MYWIGIVPSPSDERPRRVPSAESMLLASTAGVVQIASRSQRRLEVLMLGM